MKVRIVSMEAFAAFFRSIPKKSQPKFFHLIPDVLNILPPLKEASESDELSSAFMALIELAELCPNMFRGLFNNLLKFSVSVVGDKDLGDNVRQNALELMATFADYKPNMCKKDPDFAKEMVTQCLSLMTDIGIDDDDASEWNASDDVSLLQSKISIVPGNLESKISCSSTWKTVIKTTSLVNSAWTVWQTSSAVKSSCPPLLPGSLG